jgi:hypothetical protein
MCKKASCVSGGTVLSEFEHLCGHMVDGITEAGTARIEHRSDTNAECSQKQTSSLAFVAAACATVHITWVHRKINTTRFGT